MNDSVRQFVIKLLLEKGPIPDLIIIDDYSYLDEGHIDSLSFIKFIFRIEDEFKIQLLSADISGSDIRTVGRLIHLIELKILG